MKTLLMTSVLFSMLMIGVQGSADQLTDRCSGISTNSQKVIVMVYRGQNSTAASADALIVVSETNKGRRVFPARISGGSDVSQILTSGNNKGLKLTIHDAGPGYLWLGDGGETFALTCQTR